MHHRFDKSDKKNIYMKIKYEIHLPIYTDANIYLHQLSLQIPFAIDKINCTVTSLLFGCCLPGTLYQHLIIFFFPCEGGYQI